MMNTFYSLINLNRNRKYKIEKQSHTCRYEEALGLLPGEDLVKRLTHHFRVKVVGKDINQTNNG